jgi:hypothetical protein
LRRNVCSGSALNQCGSRDGSHRDIFGKKNIDETHSKQPKINLKIHTSLWILKLYLKKKIREPKCQMFVISKKNIPWGKDLKIYRKSTA